MVDVSPLPRELLAVAVGFEAGHRLAGREGAVATLILHEIDAGSPLPFHLRVPGARLPYLTRHVITLRASGLLPAAALAVRLVIAVRTGGRLRALPWLALPAVPLVLYGGYLAVHPGDWTAWKHARERGWYRTFHLPWDACSAA